MGGHDNDAAAHGTTAHASEKRLPECPMPKANILSRLSYWWLNDYFRVGASRPLQEEDMFELLTADSTTRLADQLEAAWQREQHRRSPSFLRALLLAGGWRFWMAGVGGFVQSLARIAQTQFLARMLVFFASPDAPVGEGLAYAAGIVGCGLISMVLHHQVFFEAWRCGLHLRMAATGVLFRRAARLRLDSVSQTTVGQVVNIASTDIERYQLLGTFVHFMWVSAVEGLIVLVFLWRQVGVATLAGLGVLLVMVPLQVRARSSLCRGARLTVALRAPRSCCLPASSCASVAAPPWWRMSGCGSPTR